MPKPDTVLSEIRRIDPVLADTLTADVRQRAGTLSASEWQIVRDEALWSLSVEGTFGNVYIRQLVHLLGCAATGPIARYRAVIREAAAVGPTIAGIYARHLAPVARFGDSRMIDRVLKTTGVMLGKGSYTLNTPLKTLAVFLQRGETAAVEAYLELLESIFARDLSYNQCQELSHTVPNAVAGFAAPRRQWQTRRLLAVVESDVRLVRPFLDGMNNGLRMLTQPALDRFVRNAVSLCERQPERGVRYLSLASREGRDACTALQMAVALADVRPRLARYLRARIGRSISLAPLSSLPAPVRRLLPATPTVLSDSRCIYLPEEIDCHTRKSDNIELYTLLTKLEIGLHELDTFDFDMDKAVERCRDGISADATAPASGMADLDRFFHLFPRPELAEALFTVFEHGRQDRLLARRYPGLMRRARPLLQSAFEKNPTSAPFFNRLYPCIVFGTAGTGSPGENGFLQEWRRRFDALVRHDPAVESGAPWVAMVYPDADRSTADSADTVPLLTPPFGRRLFPDLYRNSEPALESAAATIKTAVEAHGLRIYRSDIKAVLRQRRWQITVDDLQHLLQPPQGDHTPAAPFDRLKADLTRLLGRIEVVLPAPDADSGDIFWYSEWDAGIGDYLEQHVRVRDRQIGGPDNRFYQEVLTRRKSLVKGIRQVFELIKPEGLKILRQWTEGDAFDYRALIDYALDRKAGRTPSDRLYIKRIKEERDISALILVDMSRSTANPVVGTDATVLDVEKEALVLFCEALEVLGDRYAISGFSGTSRLGVDYYQVKGFDDPLTDAVRQRIGSMAPQRSTRMGAAIRHATSRLEEAASRVRLLMILGDGFPNDLDYKQGYAIADTRKAVFEARSKNIHVKAITVNISADPKLDDLYGAYHHNVITDVRELPDKLLRMYSALTR